MKRRYWPAAVFAAAILVYSHHAAALDYGRHSDEQLILVRETNLFMNDADRRRFAEEWQRRFGSTPWTALPPGGRVPASAQIRPASWSFSLSIGHGGGHRYYRHGYGHHKRHRFHRGFHGYAVRPHYYGRHRGPSYGYRDHGYRSHRYDRRGHYRYKGGLHEHRPPYGRGPWRGYGRHHH